MSAVINVCGRKSTDNILNHQIFLAKIRFMQQVKIKNRDNFLGVRHLFVSLHLKSR